MVSPPESSITVSLLLMKIRYLLTMSPQIGINYLDKNSGEIMKDPVMADSLGQDSSVLEALRQRAKLCNPFEKEGMIRSGIESLEWFLVFLVTEFEATPHNLRQGRNAPDIQKAYSTIVSDLVCLIWTQFT